MDGQLRFVTNLPALFALPGLHQRRAGLLCPSALDEAILWPLGPAARSRLPGPQRGSAVGLYDAEYRLVCDAVRADGSVGYHGAELDAGQDHD